jgi:hypothetical protein
LISGFLGRGPCAGRCWWRQWQRSHPSPRRPRQPLPGVPPGRIDAAFACDSRRSKTRSSNIISCLDAITANSRSESYASLRRRSSIDPSRLISTFERRSACSLLLLTPAVVLCWFLATLPPRRPPPPSCAARLMPLRVGSLHLDPPDIWSVSVSSGRHGKNQRKGQSLHLRSAGINKASTFTEKARRIGRGCGPTTTPLLQ